MMNRTKSTLSLRNLANSIKQSISNETHKTAKKQINLLKTSNISLHLNYKQQQKDYNNSQMNLKKQQRQNRRYVLQKQISKLEKQLQINKNYIKNYKKELNEYQQINQNIIAQEALILDQKNNIQLYRNQIMMIQQDIFSHKFNSQERIAQKQYFQVILQTYLRQYQGQAQLTMNIIHLEGQNELFTRQIQQIDKQISKSNKQIMSWKQQNGFELKNHKIKNSLKLIRVQLFELEDLCNNFCNENGLKSLRQLYCLYYKIYAKRNGLGNREGDNGLDLFICKYGLVEDFSQFIRQRLVYNQPKCHTIQKYLQTLNKMQQLYIKNNIEPLKKLNDLFLLNLQQLKKQKSLKQKRVLQNSNKIKEQIDKIDNMFNNESIAIIQFLRQKNNNKYDIKQIKIKLKQYKKQQKQRIIRMRNIYQQIQLYQKIIDKNYQHCILGKKEEILQLSEEMFNSQVRIQEINHKKQKLQKKKVQLQDYISSGVSKWKESDQNKQKLQKLYAQLNKIKEDGQFQFTRNKIPSMHSSINRQEDKYADSYHHNEVKSLKCHRKHNSLTSLHDSKSLLSLGNPYKRTVNISNDFTQYQPIISDCQMILSKKLSSKDLNKETVYKESKHNIQSRFQNNNSFLKKTAEKTQKQNIWLPKQNKIACNLKLSISSKTTNCQQTNNKGKLLQSQRISLSNLLISKFNK